MSYPELWQYSRCLLYETCTPRLFRHTGVAAPLTRQSEPRRVENGQRALGILELASADELECTGERHRFQRHELILLVRHFTVLEARGHERVNALVGEAWRRVERVQVFDPFRGASGLLAQLALGAHARIFVAVELA